MSWKGRISGFFICFLLAIAGHAQIPVEKTLPSSNLRFKTISTLKDSIRLDSVSIIPQSVSIPLIADKDYKIDYVNAILIWRKKPATPTVTIHYRVFPFRLNPVAQRMFYDSVANNFYVQPIAINTGLENNSNKIFDFGKIKAQGSFGRQIGFGNSQDAVLNSTLNLQLNGMLGDSIEINAAITDNNIPIQPDGNTQQLNEFDQVFLQFKKRNWQLNLGDLDIRADKSYFLNFYKRLQGISFQTNQRIGKNINTNTLVSGSIAKGKFTRNIITPQEGNQGPYRLQGANHEFFFIVLANTERVFIDGELLQRGEDQDYIINYNTAEITFTPRRMITKDSRIQVEFEYADRNYLNANLYISEDVSVNDKLKIHLGAFSNSDAKNTSINQVLDTKQKQFLADLGDSVQKAFYPAAVRDTLTSGKILYEKIYVGADSIYQYSTDPNLAHYNLSFVDVGQGKGDYVPDFNGANGKVYKYVAPIGGLPQGQFAPVQILVAPKTQQIFNLGIEYALNAQTQIKAEVATSNTDVNTFSKINNGDDRGWGAKIQLSNEKVLHNKKEQTLSTGIDYEYVQGKFKPLERLRKVEFSRDWGLQLDANPIPADENILRATVALKNKKNFGYTYQFTNYHRSDNYNGFQQQLSQLAELKGWQFKNSIALTNFNLLTRKGFFLRPSFDISKIFEKLNNWQLGFNYSLQKNKTTDKLTDTLLPTSFTFDIYSAYLKSDQTKNNKYQVTFFTRSDQYPVYKDFIRGDRSLNLNIQAAILSNPKRQLYINTTFRKLKIYDAAVSNQKADETILGRVEYLMNEWKGLLTGNVLYEVGAGQEQKRDFAYLEVPAGTGQFAWNDYNGDGIQQLNEFELAAFPDQAKFIRIFTPTNEFIKANYITFNYNFTITPKALIPLADAKGFNKLLANIILITSLQTNKKSIAAGSFEFNPFKYGIADTALINLNTTILNTFSFNRFNSHWGIDITNLRSNAKSLLTYGYETRKLNDWKMKWRWNINRSMLLTVNGHKGKHELSTPSFANRNYLLNIYGVEPFVTYIRGTKFRIVGGYKFEIQKNKPDFGGEKSVSNSLQVEGKYNILQSSALTAKFTFNNISYDFPANTTVSYIMLNGLLPGRNYLWSLGFSKRLLNNLEINLNYDGRKAGQSRTVHLGRASITALF